MDALGNSPQGPRQTARKSCGGQVRRLSRQFALIDAVRRGRAAAVAALLAANANVNQADNEGTTPLYSACQEGHTEIATKLLAANPELTPADKNGATPLFIACKNGCESSVRKPKST